MKGCYIIIVLIIGFVDAFSQIQIDRVEVDNFQSSFRGLYLVNDTVAWAAGSDGVYMKTTNSENWLADTIPSCSHLDFRDIHAFDGERAIVMSSGEGCLIYRTEDGGENWSKVYENLEKEIFFDGMDFWDDKSGIAFSDPVDGNLYIIRTTDGGKSWKPLKSMPSTLKNEAGFAASGTGIVCKGDSTIWIATGGGDTARVFKSINRGESWKIYNTPMRGGEGNGIYSMTFFDERNGIIVGGNYLDSLNTKGSCAVTSDGGETWQLISVNGPRGYRSCVAVNNNFAIAVGRTGIDITSDKGYYWMPLSNEGYYSCVLNTRIGWLTGRKGKLAKVTIK
ncbi:MAG: glycosyl hydrolase [Flavobacteriales bacterium]|nr:glycosyl hydrolase [Flavobacteriales bacterium]